MIAADITPAQLRRLQVLYGQYEKHSLDCPGAARRDRLQWASAACGRVIASFKGLTLDEGRRLIDGLQKALGHKAANKSPVRKRSKRDAQKQGTEGRHDQIHAETTLAGSREFSLIRRDLDRLGWNQARLDAFLASSSGPNKRSTLIRTLAEANRVHWALKRIKPDGAQQYAS